MATNKSTRLTPNNFAAGLDISATRMQADLVALANRYSAPLPSDIARRWVETHMVAGFLPNRFPAPATADDAIPQALPWMGAYNSTASIAQPAPAAADIVNPWRQKAIKQTGINPAQADSGDILSWEQSWSKTTPTLLDSIQITLATDSVYANAFVWGASGAHGGGVTGRPVDNIVVQVLVDSALAVEKREASLLPSLVRSFNADTYEITQSFIAGTTDTMQPVPSAKTTIPTGLCITVYPRQPLPENARVRVILSLPQYSSTIDGVTDVDGFGYNPWATFVLSSHVTILCPAVSA